MSFGVFHNGNIAVIGGGQGDEGAALVFDIAWDRKTPKSTFAFSYRPSFVVYRESSDLDYFGNTIVLSFSQEVSRASRFNVDAYISRTDYQGPTADTADRATTFVARSTLTLATAKVGGTVDAGRRGFVDWELRGGVDLYKDVNDDPATVGVDEGQNFNDGTGIGGRIAWRDELSARNTLGLGLDIAHFGYESEPSVVVESLGLVGTCQAGPSWMLDYAAGGSRATSDGESIDGLSFNATIEYSAGKASTLGAGARQVFAPGTGLGGATQDRGVWLSYAHNAIPRGLSGSVIGGYWQRDALEFASAPPTGDTATFTVNGSIGWNFNRYLTLRGAYVYIDQSARNGSDPALDTNYSSYGLDLRWAIRGR
jgi:hypothetical protein